MVLQGPDHALGVVVTLRLSLRRCVKTAFETSGSHAPLRRTQEPEELTTATQSDGATRKRARPFCPVTYFQSPLAMKGPQLTG